MISVDRIIGYQTFRFDKRILLIDETDFGVSIWQTKEGKFVNKGFYVNDDKYEYKTVARGIFCTPLVDIRSILFRSYHDMYRLMGLMFLKMLRFGPAVDETVCNFQENTLSWFIDISEECTLVVLLTKKLIVSGIQETSSTVFGRYCFC